MILPMPVSPLTAAESFWDDLLDLIEDGKVIPVLGESLLTFGSHDTLLHPWLARRLEERLGLPASPPHALPTLNEVACRHLLAGGARNLIYTRLNRLLKEETLEPGRALRALASVEAFNLYLTTGFDALLVRALDETRHAGQAVTKVFAYSPEAEQKDLPTRRHNLLHPAVFHVLGRVSATPDFVVWEEDALEFICRLHEHMPVMPHLARDLKESGLLILGLNFSDWLVRFFLRVAKQDPLSKIQTHTALAEGPPGGLPESMVMFFGGVSRNIHVLPCDPRIFAIELADRWRARHPVARRPQIEASPGTPSRLVPDGAIFLSYAREDEAAVRLLKARLEAAGCLVWFDQDPDRIRCGENYERSMEAAIKGECTAFVSVISRMTELGREERACFKERNWAEERSRSFPGMEGFYFGVGIDEVDLPPRREPAVFATRHVERAPGGLVDENFARRLFEIQSQRLRERRAAAGRLPT